MSVNNDYKFCPICNRMTRHAVYVKEKAEEKEPTSWFKCSCNIIFQENKPTEFKIKNYDIKKIEKRSIHAIKTYLNIIEDITNGRKVLEVGYSGKYKKEYFNDRGWIYFGLSDEKSESDRFIEGRFEELDFKENKFDLIWLDDVFQSFLEPKKIIEKCYSLLNENGCLFIITPDIDAINSIGVPAWSHWSKKDHHIMWSQESLKRELKKSDFEIIISRKSYCMRYLTRDNIHFLAHKIYT